MKQKSIKPLVYISILNYLNYQDTIESIKSILKICYHEIKIGIIDNKSPNDSYAQLAKFLSSIAKEHVFNFDANFYQKYNFSAYKAYSFQYAENHRSIDIELIETACNGGFAYGHNTAVRFAQSRFEFDYFLVLNNDLVFESSFLSKLILAIERNDDYAIAGPMIMNYNYPERCTSSGGSFNPWLCHAKFHKDLDAGFIDGIKEVSFLSGCAWLIPAITIKRLGLPDERFFMYFEDIEYSQRIFLAGYKLIVSRKSLVFHKGEMSSKSVSSDFSSFWNHRNYICFVFYFLKPLQRLTALTSFLYFTIIATARAIIKFKNPRLGAMIRGLASGLHAVIMNKF